MTLVYIIGETVTPLIANIELNIDTILGRGSVSIQDEGFSQLNCLYRY
jgi:hypothetical protein